MYLIQLLKSIECIIGKKLDYDVNIKRDFIAIREYGAKVFLDNSIEKQHPDVTKEWNYEKNGGLLPSMFSSGSSQKVWWRCASGHEWQAAISRRARGSECPYCSGRIANQGENDLQTKYPSLFREWNSEKNVELDIKTIPVGSHKKAFWICSKCGLEWQASLYSRTQLGTGCPKCGREKVKSSHYKSVKNLDTGEIFECVRDAAKKYNITPANISACCSGRRNVAGGYHWALVSD